jgi:hypothetical protein
MGGMFGRDFSRPWTNAATEPQFKTSRVSSTRRAFLGGAAGAAGLAALPAFAQEGRGGGVDSRRFTRMFPQLPPFGTGSSQMLAALNDIGKPGGIMDARDNLAAGPAELILDPKLSANNANADLPGATAGTTFMGQFIDHDMTFDATSRLGVPAQPNRSPNARIPALDLDSVYGGGPVAQSVLYERRDRAKFRVESGGQFEDLPRDSDSSAIIADRRNDENLMIAGLQVAFLKFHNRAVDRLRSNRNNDAADVFTQARRVTTWHYHWIVLHEILPSFIGQQLVNDILQRGRRFYRPEDEADAAIPVEFQGAAYRFGHSMVRPSYRANLRGDNGAAFFGMIFDPAAEDQADPIDMRGGARARRRFIGWQTFFDFRDGEVRPRKRIDTRISTPLFNLPLGAIASGTPPTVLPQRNLLRHLTWQLPSGQAIAQTMRVPALSPGDLSELAGYGVGLERSTPLWYYILKEAELTGGQHLGPVGGRIVGEVIIGLLQVDRDTFLTVAPNWVPTLPARDGPTNFRMADFLTFAGVDPASRGQ